jgi:Fe-S-cluster containining protein
MTTVTQSLPVLNCDGCGVCCHGQAALPVGWYVGFYANADEQAALPPPLLASLGAMRERFDAEGWPPDGSPCVWYDDEARRCRHHEHRPEVCRDFEVGGEGCLRLREERLTR